MKTVGTMTAAAVGAMVPSLALAQNQGNWFGHGYGGHMMGWGGGYGMVFGFFFMLIVLALLIAAVVVLARWIGWGPSTPRDGNSLDILKERFARGEIDKDDYEERRRVLGA